MSDETKVRILARRAQLVAAALTAACEPAAKPVPCLETIAIPAASDAGELEASPDIVPVPCLEVVGPPPDAGALDASKPKRKPDAGANPQPCLKPMKPNVCLYMY